MEQELDYKRLFIHNVPFILKEEDRTPLRDWQTEHGISIHIWHVFYDMAFGITFDRAEELIANGLIEPTEHTFQASNGAQSKKILALPTLTGKRE
jgi:hypothetical protein